MHRVISITLGALFLMAGAAFAGAPASSPELVSKGRTAYTTYCVACHGDKGDGNGPAGGVLNPKPRDLRVKDEKVGGHYKQGGKTDQLYKTISTGLPGTSMVAFASIPEPDRWGIVYYIQQEFQKKK